MVTHIVTTVIAIVTATMPLAPYFISATMIMRYISLIYRKNELKQ